METHRLISVFLQHAQQMPNMRTFQMGDMRLRVCVLVYNPTFGPNSYDCDRVAYTPTLKLCGSSCNWGGERLDIWCRNSCFLQDGWQLLIILYHESEYVSNATIGVVPISLANLTNPAMGSSRPQMYQVILLFPRLLYNFIACFLSFNFC